MENLQPDLQGAIWAMRLNRDISLLTRIHSLPTIIESTEEECCDYNNQLNEVPKEIIPRRRGAQNIYCLHLTQTR